jgi:protein-tyrosine phosphatase
LSNISEIEITDAGGENINMPVLEKIDNFRDFGGYDTIYGKKIRKYTLFRSGYIDNLKGDDLYRFLSFGIKTIIDLRSPKEIRSGLRKINGIKTINLPIFTNESTRNKLKSYFFKKDACEEISNIIASVYAGYVHAQKHIIREVIELLITNGNLPILIHCRGGKDRTGFVTAVIHMALGVDKKLIIHDYLLTNQYLRVKVERAAKIVKFFTFGKISERTFNQICFADERYIERMMDTLISNFGNISAYLQECGISIEKMLILQQKLLE